MPIIRIPRRSEPNANEANAILERALTQPPNRCACLVFGDTPAVPQSCVAAETRALSAPASRHVVWIPDADAVSGARPAAWKRKPADRAIFLTAAGAVAARLTAEDCIHSNRIEQAFLKAQSGKGE